MTTTRATRILMQINEKEKSSVDEMENNAGYMTTPVACGLAGTVLRKVAYSDEKRSRNFLG